MVQRKGKPAAAYSKILTFKGEAQSLLAAGVLTPEQAGPLVSAADALLQSLRVGGGF